MAANYLAAFRGPDLAQIDRAAYSNALLRNERDRIPQMNRMQDLAIEADQQTLNMRQQALTDQQRENARGIAANGFAALAQASDPRIAGRQLLGSADFRAAMTAAGIPVDQFTITDQDDPEQLRQSAMMWARTLGGNVAGDQRRVQSAQVLEDGTIAYLTSDGQIVRTNEKARNPLQVIEVAGGKAAFDPRSGLTQPLSTPDAEIDAAAERAGAEAWARAAAQAGVERQTDLSAKQSTLGVWRVARQGLMSALSGTTTGPIAGRMPALTAGQQTADGAVAAVAPVLKQLFRSAGEGVFTDRDQQLLLDMVPTREDLPEARENKMQMIDAIIEAKLSAGAAGAQSQSFATEQEAAAAAASGRIKPGDRITVGGVSGVWQ